MDLLYKAEMAGLNLRFTPQDETGRDDAIRAWEQLARADREWAAGYRRGRADAATTESHRQGPGVMPDDPKDGWSPSLDRLAGYEDGLHDGHVGQGP